MRLKQFLILFLASCLTFIPLLSGCIDSDDDVETETITGKVAQEHVANATVFWDLNSNFKLDPKEEKYSTTTSPNGSFEVTVPKNTLSSEMLVAINGTVGDSDRKSLPMIASKDADNITPVTTLVQYVPNLKDDIGDKWDADIASKSGVDGKILQLALSVESMQSQLSDTPVKLQFKLISSLAENLTDKDLSNDDHIVSAVKSTLNNADLLKSNLTDAEFTALSATVVENVQTVCDAVNENRVQYEAEIQKEVGNQIYNKVALAFDPTNATKPIVPMPNDLTWNPTGGKVWFNATKRADGDKSKEVFYTALNQLNNKGLSPNSPIAIPMNNGSVPLDSDSLNSETIKVIDLNTILFVMESALTDIGYQPQNATLDAIGAQIAQLTDADMEYLEEKLTEDYYLGNYTADVSATQDGKYIKAYPTEPLKAGHKYLVAVMDDIKLANSNSNLAGSKTFNLLKSKELPEKVKKELNKNQTALRNQYARFFDYLLKPYTLERSEILEIFTFTTAEKNLNLNDLSHIVNAIEHYKKDPSFGFKNYLSENLNKPDYGMARTEYNRTRNSTIPVLAIDSNSTSNATSFTSYDFTSEALRTAIVSVMQDDNPRDDDIGDYMTEEELQKATRNVPYNLYNSDVFNDGSKDVLVFQHGLGGDKADVEAIKDTFQDYTVVSMDLPKHGDRPNAGEDFFTSSLPTNRMNLYHSYFDLSMFIKMLNSKKFDLDDDGSNETPNNIYFIGQSLGSIVGSVPVENYLNTTINKADLTVGGANMAALFDSAKAPKLKELVDSFDVEKNTTPYFVKLGVMQMVIDPADPAYLIDENSKPSNLMLQFAHQDTWVSNNANEILASSFGFDNVQRVTPTNYTFLDATNKTYVFGEGDNWAPHGFMMSPEITGYPKAEDYLTKPYAEDLNQASRNLLIEFFK